jgi:hypothetical protein
LMLCDGWRFAVVKPPYELRIIFKHVSRILPNKSVKGTRRPLAVLGVVGFGILK